MFTLEEGGGNMWNSGKRGRLQIFAILFSNHSPVLKNLTTVLSPQSSVSNFMHFRLRKIREHWMPCTHLLHTQLTPCPAWLPSACRNVWNERTAERMKPIRSHSAKCCHLYQTTEITLDVIGWARALSSALRAERNESSWRGWIIWASDKRQGFSHCIHLSTILILFYFYAYCPTHMQAVKKKLFNMP